jgi:hypothetical protein
MYQSFGTLCLFHLHRSCKEEEGNKGKVALVHVNEGVWTRGVIPLIHNLGIG